MEYLLLVTLIGAFKACFCSSLINMFVEVTMEGVAVGPVTTHKHTAALYQTPQVFACYKLLSQLKHLPLSSHV